MAGQRDVWLLCSFCHEPLRTWIETNVNKFAISNHTALKLDVQTLRGFLSLICEYELYILPNKKVSTVKDHGRNYMKDRPLILPYKVKFGLNLQENHLQFIVSPGFHPDC